MSLTVTILGCGSSGGVPRVGANGWGDCDPNNPKNRRRRCSILISQRGGEGETSVLVDTSPDLREQLISTEITKLDAVIYTHDHADHTHGIDDLRPIVLVNRKRIDAWSDEATFNGLNTRFGYIFASPPGSDYPPILNDRRIAPREPVRIAGHGGALTVQHFPLIHGNITALGLRVGNIAYTPDMNAIPDEALPFLENLDTWIIDALRIRPHPSHFNLEQALAWIERMKPRRAILTNMHNDLDYEQLRSQLPSHIEPAFDGMEIRA
jgi:phosphoribosyl 1,2-cyclic phosphate phosphodiesterase